MHNIGEGSIAIPADWHNSSINIFTAQPPGVPGVSVTINRDRLPLGGTLTSYTKAQNAKLSEQLKNHQLIQEDAVTVDGKPGFLLEYTWDSPDVGPVHQLLLAVADHQLILNFAATSVGKMNDDLRSNIVKMLLSFHFNPIA